ncbi:MAG: transposase [Akkermansia sp.]|nr:transposase [Akkermansia sp.]
MRDTYSNIYLHIIFHTKNIEVPIEENDLPEVFRYIGGVIRSSSGTAYVVGGRSDHIHILTSLPHTISLSDFVRGIKANTSRWIKSIHPRYKNFSWQAGYGAFSVSESCKETVINYILNQKEHYKIVSAYDEYLLFLEKMGFWLPGPGLVNKIATIYRPALCHP